MIIGLTGRIAAGKGKIVDFLSSKGFEYYTISKVVREEAERLGLAITRDELQNIGDLIRKKEGAGAWAKRLIKKFDKNKSYIVDGIRNPGEIKELRKCKNFHLIAIDAPQKIRFERMLKRAKPSDPVTWEEFIKIDERDYEDKDNPLGQQVGLCMKQADFIIENNTDLEELDNKIKKIYSGVACKS